MLCFHHNKVGARVKLGHGLPALVLTAQHGVFIAGDPEINIAYRWLAVRVDAMLVSKQLLRIGLNVTPTYCGTSADTTVSKM